MADKCKHKWVRFNGPEYPHRVGIMILCDELYGCELCGCVKARCTTPLECEDGDFYWPPVIVSGVNYIRQINQMGMMWADWAKPSKDKQKRIELGFLVAQEIGWPAWKTLPEGWIEAWVELDQAVGGENFREFDRLVGMAV